MLKSGDFVIWRKPGIDAICAYCRILDDVALPDYRETGALAEAQAKANAVLSQTGGRLHQLTEPTNTTTWTALDFALVALCRAVNALLTARIVIPFFVLLAIAGWPI